MPDLSPLIWISALLITAGAAAIQGAVGVGYGLVAVPILALIDPALSPVPQLLTVLPMTVVMLIKERSDIDLKGLGWLVAGRFPGAGLGLVLLSVATQRTLDLFIGSVVLAAVIILGAGVTVSINPVTQFLAGVASGATSLVASIGGPPTALLYSREKASTIRSTLAAVFTFGVTFSIAVRFASGNVSSSDLRVALVLLPAVIVGLLISLRYKDAVPQTRVRLGVLVVSGVAAVGLLVRALG